MMMDPHKSEETLHSYLRRHFERISRNKARQMAEQLGGFREDVAAEIWDVTQTGDKRD
jgi:hypothetical protein